MHPYFGKGLNGFSIGEYEPHTGFLMLLSCYSVLALKENLDASQKSRRAEAIEAAGRIRPL